MAMERLYMIRDAHTRSITAVGLNPVRRELIMGCEDGVVKTFEMENGKPVATFLEHKGWVTDFLFWTETKLILSSANDGDILAWGIGGGVTDRIKIGIPVFCIALMPKRHQLLCGVNGAIRIYALDDDRESGHVINSRMVYQVREHTDIVRCIVCLDNRVFSGGYDNKLVIYDCNVEKARMEPVFNQQVHSAGITCLSIAVDIENIWVLTGSFDKTLKIWTVDGALLQTMDNFPSTVTGVIYIPRNKTVWVASGAPHAWLYEPKSGDKVSDFIGTFQNMAEEKYQLMILKYFPDISQAVASTSRRQILLWKYNTAGCITALRCSCPIESLCYTSKVPILIFSGDHEGFISKWERNQSNPFKYNKEVFMMGDLAKCRVVGERSGEESKKKLALTTASKNVNTSKSHKAPQSSYAYRQIMPRLSTHSHSHTTIMKILFIEALDYIIAASEDSNIYVWGFDYGAVKALQSMRPAGVDELVRKYSILLDPQSPLRNPRGRIGEDSVTNRVAGFTCKMVLSNHMGCVTSLVTIEKSFKWPSTYVLSGGWDRRICLWDVENGSLKTVFRNPSAPPNASVQMQEIACDGIIHDIAFSSKTSEYAYASSDKVVYIRKFNLNGARMAIVNTLQGHDSEVTAVGWSSTYNKWVSGSEDGTVRIWNGLGMNECEQILNVNKAVTCLCIDQFVGTLVVGVQCDIRVYEPVNYCLVQNNLGHVDAIRSIMHIPERHHYVSCSWDCTIRVWNAWKPARVKTTGSKVGVPVPTVCLGPQAKGGVKQLLARNFQNVSRKLVLSVNFSHKLRKSSEQSIASQAHSEEDQQPGGYKLGFSRSSDTHWHH